MLRFNVYDNKLKNIGHNKYYSNMNFTRITHSEFLILHEISDQNNDNPNED